MIDLLLVVLATFWAVAGEVIVWVLRLIGVATLFAAAVFVGAFLAEGFNVAMERHRRD